MDGDPIRDGGTMSYAFAIAEVKLLQKDHPDWYLCGSVELILLGILDKREVHDIDFSVDVDKFEAYELLGKDNDCLPPSLQSIEDDQGRYVNIRAMCDPPCCLFIMGEHKGGFYHDGILCQDVKESLFWKQEMGRDKGNEPLNGNV